MDVAIVSDSHVPTRAAMVPPPHADRLRAADHVIHAGDFDTREAFETIRSLADENGGELTAVRGNTDPPLDLPDVATVTLGDVAFVVTHGTGPRHSYDERVAGIVRDAGGPDAVGIAGHSHRLRDDRVGGVRLLNPGSVTGASTDEATMLTADVTGELTVTVHRS